MRNSLRSLLLALLLAVAAPPAFAACTTGQTNCNTDTISDAAIIAAIRSPQVQQRVYGLWIQSCYSNVWGEAPTTAGHLQRVGFCNQLAAGGGINQQGLVALIMNSIVQGEVLGTCAIPAGVDAAAGCMVDADVNNAIATLMQVTVTSASTTATASLGTDVLTVTSATNIVLGQSVWAVGVPFGTSVINVSGTSVTISQPTSAALSTTPVLFTLSTGLP